MVALLLLLSSAHAASLAFTGADSTVSFHNAASLHEFSGKAKTFSGTIDTTALTGQLTITTSAMTTFLGPRDDKMRSYCLETSRFPAITFTVSSITGSVDGIKAGSGTGSVTLVGKLTIRDVTRDVQIPATYTWEGGSLRLKGNYAMKWTDYNVPDPSILISTLYPDMSVNFDILAKPA